MPDERSALFQARKEHGLEFLAPGLDLPGEAIGGTPEYGNAIGRVASATDL